MPEQNQNPSATSAILGTDTDASTPSTTLAPPLVARTGPQTPAPAAPQNAQPQTQADPAIAAKVAHHAKLGQLVSHLFTGEHQEFSVNPETGQMTAQTVREKPGQFFRSLAASALIGMAAGSPSANGGQTDFATGLGRGASAAIGMRQRQDEQRYERARQTATDQREFEDARQKRIYNQAQIAHMHVEDLRMDANMNLSQQEHLDKLNEQAGAYITSAKNVGAKEANIMVGGRNINGMADNGRQFMAAVQKDPSMLQDPQGYHRFHVQTVDYNGLEWREGKWIDTQSGKEVDLASRTTHTVYDIPEGFWSQKRQVGGAEVNKIAGYSIADPSKTYNMSMQELTGLRTDATKNLRELTLAQYELARSKQAAAAAGLAAERTRVNLATANKAEMQAAYQAFTTKLRADNEELSNLSKDPDPNDETKARIEEKRQEMEQDGQYLVDLQARLFPRSAAPNPTAPNPPAPTGAPVPTPGSQDAGFAAGRAALNRGGGRPSLQVGQQVTLKNGQTVTVKKINPNGTFEY